jgi:hypothetical protein
MKVDRMAEQEARELTERNRNIVGDEDDDIPLFFVANRAAYHAA